MRTFCLTLLLLSAACGGSSSDQKSCRIPESVAEVDASTGGCSASPTFEVCQDNGDGTETCTNQCTASEYALSCRLPPPATEAHTPCRILPLPTPMGVDIYCCPCQ
jgi:hypothetical protein